MERKPTANRPSSTQLVQRPKPQGTRHSWADLRGCFAFPGLELRQAYTLFLSKEDAEWLSGLQDHQERNRQITIFAKPLVEKLVKEQLVACEAVFQANPKDINPRFWLNSNLEFDLRQGTVYDPFFDRHTKIVSIFDPMTDPARQQPQPVPIASTAAPIGPKLKRGRRPREGMDDVFGALILHLHAEGYPSTKGGKEATWDIYRKVAREKKIQPLEFKQFREQSIERLGATWWESLDKGNPYLK